MIDVDVVERMVSPWRHSTISDRARRQRSRREFDLRVAAVTGTDRSCARSQPCTEQLEALKMVTDLARNVHAF